METAKEKLKLTCVTLGCDKNRVDTEHVLAQLLNYNFEICQDENVADVLLINTCAFISSARVESINEIMHAVSLNTQGKIKKIVVIGCLPQLSFSEVQEAIPEVDLFLKIKDYKLLPQKINQLFNIQTELENDDDTKRVLTTNKSYAYLKIADGCDNCCSYCTIPRIRGRYKSVKIEKLVKEAKWLSKEGVKELILVAQDVTRYGEDIYSENKLIELLEQLCKLDFTRIRLHYLYPEKITEQLLNFMDNNQKICKYIDMPLQHASDRILKLMNRRSNIKQIEEKLSYIKSLKNSFVIRTTFIVGYPGETALDFKILCNFLKKHRLNNVGFFKYSKEEKTPAFFQKFHLHEFTKNRRLKIIQKLQERIATENNLNRIGQVVDVVVEGYDEKEKSFVCLDQFASPGIDYDIYVSSDKISIGNVAKVKIISYNNYVFKGEIV